MKDEHTIASSLCEGIRKVSGQAGYLYICMYAACTKSVCSAATTRSGTLAVEISAPGAQKAGSPGATILGTSLLSSG